MHFALPPKKSSFPPPYARSSAKSATPQRRRRQLQTISYGVLVILTLFLVVRWFRSAGSDHNADNSSIPKDSSVIIVTVFDSNMSEDMVTMVRANRDDYAVRHGYKTFYTNESTYGHPLETSPPSWAVVPALRHTLSLYPDIDYIWSLSPCALITNITVSLHQHIFAPLPSLMLKNIPVVPPDSVIHTSPDVNALQAHLIISQDVDNLAHTSFLLRNTQTLPTPSNKPKNTWTQYLLDAWFDPLYRSYAFQKAENHALEHIVQWHPTVLAKLAVIDQRRINSYNFQSSEITDSKTGQTRKVDSMWKPGDLIVNFKGCEEAKERDCEKEMRRYFYGWTREVEFFDGKKPNVELKVKDYIPKQQDKDQDKKEDQEKHAPRVHI